MNIVEFIAAASDQDKEFLILTEFCGGGSLVDHLQKQRLETFAEVLQTFYQICQGVRHLHSQNPPIIHRDIKIENVLLSDKYYIKLIDFGSTTTSSYNPDSTWTGAKRSFVEDEMSRNTTPMYRPPEILDLYQNLPINESIDVWALGCVLYMLCFNEHPYADSSKLRIVNANYPTAPFNSDKTFNHFHDLIRGSFQIDPRQRPKITDILERLAEFGETFGIPLAKPLRFFASRGSQPPHPIAPAHHSPVQQRSQQQPRPASPAQHAGDQPGLFGGQFMNQIKGQAGSFVKSMKDASNKMVDAVQSGVGRNDLDIIPITSRILVMPQPSEGVETVMAGRNNIDEVRAFLDAKFYGNYAVFNLSANCKYRHARFDNRVWEAGWTSERIAPLAKLFSFCHQVFSWLLQNRQHVIVIHCQDGRTLSPTAVCAFLCFLGAAEPTAAAQLVTNRRGPCLITPSAIRYCGYIAQLRSGFKPHDKTLQLGCVILKSIPVVNRQRTGCRPYIEVWCGDQLIHTSQREYDALRQYVSNDQTIRFPVNAICFGDVTISVFHARSTITDRMQGKLSGIKICQLQFHAGFIDQQTMQHPLDFDREEIDVIEQTAGTFRPDFGMQFDLKPASSSQRSVLSSKNQPWNDYQFTAKVAPEIAFSSLDEMNALMKGLKMGGARRYDVSDADQQHVEGLLDDSDEEDFSPQKPTRRNEPGNVSAGAPELPTRPETSTHFEADFSIFSPTSGSASTGQQSQNQSATLVDIWPGDTSVHSGSNRNSTEKAHDANSLFSLGGASTSSEGSSSKPQAVSNDNPFFSDFASEVSNKQQQQAPSGEAADLFGVFSGTAAPEPVSAPKGNDELAGLFNAPQPSAKPAANLFESVGEDTGKTDSPILTPSSSQAILEQTNQQQKSNDPFANICKFLFVCFFFSLLICFSNLKSVVDFNPRIKSKQWDP